MRGSCWVRRRRAERELCERGRAVSGGVSGAAAGADRTADGGLAGSEGNRRAGRIESYRTCSRGSQHFGKCSGGGVDAARYTKYLSSTKELAKMLKCRPAYLTKAAATHGYSLLKGGALDPVPARHRAAGRGVPRGDDGVALGLRRRCRMAQVLRKARGTQPWPAAEPPVEAVGAKGGGRCLFRASGERTGTEPQRKGLKGQWQGSKGHGGRVHRSSSCAGPAERPLDKPIPTREVAG